MKRDFSVGRANPNGRSHDPNLGYGGTFVCEVREFVVVYGFQQEAHAVVGCEGG